MSDQEREPDISLTLLHEWQHETLAHKFDGSVFGDVTTPQATAERLHAHCKMLEGAMKQVKP